ncbi:hypothetical protein Y032_0866g2761 [Ancylostoma ceylanicum]|uniref:EF-hand domain-containing protein n=1 Tax=Ancylostoma ceylanicum TaxID=53326 RepID=A0A016WA27_9BILA|nr:hypothetical protein Y032_0866g2761 [Ancylostoma ceylanicum]
MVQKYIYTMLGVFEASESYPFTLVLCAQSPAKVASIQIYKIFVSMDDDGSGTITANEVAQMLCGFGCDVSPKVVQAVMRSSDKSGDGEIDFEEFLAAVTSKIKLNSCKADIHAMFEKFDRNKDGLLSAEELVVAWSETLKTRITVKEAAALIQQADAEGKGAVTVNEFITMCQTV